MTKKEVERLGIINNLISGQINGTEAGKQLPSGKEKRK